MEYKFEDIIEYIKNDPDWNFPEQNKKRALDSLIDVLLHA